MIDSTNILTREVTNFVRASAFFFECEILRVANSIYFARESSLVLITGALVTCERGIVNKRMAIIYAAVGNQCIRAGQMDLS